MEVNLFSQQLSGLVARSPKLLFYIQEAWLRFGYRALDLRAASWVIRRPEWLRQKPGPVKPIESALGADSGNTKLAERCIVANRALRQQPAEGTIPSNSIWGRLLDEHYTPLCDLIEGGDAQALARYQSQIFRTGAVNGYSYGTTFDTRPHRWHYLPVQIELSVVQLAEAIGVLRAECHEQGELAFWRSLLSEEELISRIETYFGFRVEQPRFGDPHGIMFGGRFLSRETCSHLYTADRIRSEIGREGIDQPLKIVEIGGGYGGTCYWLCKILGEQLSRYVIIDLPEVGLVQSFFLGSAFPNRLTLAGEPRHEGESPVELIAHFDLSKIDFRPNILINQDSMPEMPETEVMRYLTWASDNLDGLFLSFNQETLSLGGGEGYQVWVPDVVGRFPRFCRLSRSTSWDRRGYVEEVYKTIP